MVWVDARQIYRSKIHRIYKTFYPKEHSNLPYNHFQSNNDNNNINNFVRQGLAMLPKLVLNSWAQGPSHLILQSAWIVSKGHRALL
jgi:hypothetical protein